MHISQTRCNTEWVGMCVFLNRQVWNVFLSEFRLTLSMFTAGPVCSCADTHDPQTGKLQTALNHPVWGNLRRKGKDPLDTCYFSFFIFPPSEKQFDWLDLTFFFLLLQFLDTFNFWFWTASHHMTPRPFGLWMLFISLAYELAHLWNLSNTLYLLQSTNCSTINGHLTNVLLNYIKIKSAL